MLPTWANTTRRHWVTASQVTGPVWGSLSGLLCIRGSESLPVLGVQLLCGYLGMEGLEYRPELGELFRCGSISPDPTWQSAR